MINFREVAEHYLHARKLLVVIITALFSATLCCVANGQSPSLQETLSWMANTLRPEEGNAVYTVKPASKPQDWLDMRIDLYHTEFISEFSYTGTKVMFKVIVIDNDAPLLFGLHLEETQVDTFDLSDIDPVTVKAVANDCLYCKPDKLQVSFKTRNARPVIHRESTSSSTYSLHESWQEQHEYEMSRKAFCKQMPDNEGYCELRNKKQKPQDVTSTTYGFSSPEYAARFAKALRHAVTLSGGKPSAF